jgi:hypothetical protein
MEKPTCEQLLDEDGVKRMSCEDDGSWRHGVYRTEVYLREVDGTYWRAGYRVSTDGETHELRDGGARIVQVQPVEKTVTVYEPVP